MTISETTLNHYLDAARQAQNIASDYQLAEELKITRQAISEMRRGKMLPGEDLMVEIADLANWDPQLALLHLRYWNARSGPAKTVWYDMLEKGPWMILAALAISVTAIATPPARAGLVRADRAEQCILWNRRKRARGLSGAAAAAA